MYELMRDAHIYARCIIYDAAGNEKVLKNASRGSAKPHLLFLRPQLVAQLEDGLYWLLSETGNHENLILSVLRVKDNILVQDSEVFRCDKHMEMPEEEARAFLWEKDPIPGLLWVAIEEWMFSSPEGA